VRQLIGLDIGYGFVKVTNGIVGYSFPSVVGDGHIKSSFSLGGNNLPPINDLTVGMNNRLYFVGKSAIRHSKFVYRNLAISRSDVNDFNILFFTALSLFCDKNLNEFSVVTGLPAERMYLAEELRNRINNYVSFIVYHDNTPQEVKIDLTDLAIVPQPLGTYWSQMLNPKGKVVKSLAGRTGVIDIGFGTTDLAAVEDGEYIPSKSRTIGTGIATTYNEIRTNIMAEHGLEKETYALDEAVIKRHINIGGEHVDISRIVDEAFAKLALNIAVEVNSTWSVAEHDNILVTGGGGQAISSHIMQHLPRVRCVPDSLGANSQGYLAWANRLWGYTPEVSINDGQENDLDVQSRLDKLRNHLGEDKG
jgi:plasmid segregation protein ParM